MRPDCNAYGLKGSGIMKKADKEEKVVNLKPAAAGEAPARRKGIYLLPNYTHHRRPIRWFLRGAIWF